MGKCQPFSCERDEVKDTKDNLLINQTVDRSYSIAPKLGVLIGAYTIGGYRVHSNIYKNKQTIF